MFFFRARHAVDVLSLHLSGCEMTFVAFSISECPSRFKSFVARNVSNRSMLPRKFWRPARNGIKPVSNAVGGSSVFGTIDQFDLGLCKKMLESTTLAEHNGELFCKQCYARKFVRGESTCTSASSIRFV